MAGEKNNATSSWSGYNHQGQVGIFLALKELSELIQNDEDFRGYSVQFEKEDGEDIDIVKGIEVISRHQVKANKNKKRSLKNYHINPNLFQMIKMLNYTSILMVASIVT